MQRLEDDMPVSVSRSVNVVNTMRQIDVLEGIVRKLKSASVGDDDRASVLSGMPKFVDLWKTRELEIYFHDLPALRSAESAIDPFLTFWDIEELESFANERATLNADTGTGYVCFADYEFSLVIYVLCFENCTFTGVGTTISTMWDTFTKQTNSLHEFLSLICNPNYNFQAPAQR